MNVLVVVDMQNDFVSGALGTKEAVEIVPRVAQRVEEGIRRGETVLFTRDTHQENYGETQEGRKLPVPHCLQDTWGWQIVDALQPYAANCTPVEKPTFGSTDLPALVKEAAAGEAFAVELIGLCTDICVVSNTLLLKAHYPEAPISVDAACCAGVTPATHQAALTTMGMCQIEVKS